MNIYKEQITLTSHGETPSFFDITPSVKEIIKKSNIQNGICTVISPHTTCSVFFEEFVHGGILDRFDSILFSGAVVYYYITFIIGL